jgi:hypothetical protein
MPPPTNSSSCFLVSPVLFHRKKKRNRQIWKEEEERVVYAAPGLCWPPSFHSILINNSKYTNWRRRRCCIGTGWNMASTDFIPLRCGQRHRLFRHITNENYFDAAVSFFLCVCFIPQKACALRQSHSTFLHHFCRCKKRKESVKERERKKNEPKECRRNCTRAPLFHFTLEFIIDMTSF